MQLREYEYIEAIYRHQSITKAAEALYLTQPTLSKFLKAYEEQLGTQLFERSSGRYLLTYAGKRYLEYAEKILKLRSNLEEELQEIADSQRGILRIGFQPVHSTYLMPATFGKFYHMYPNVEIDLHEDTCAALEQQLIDGDLDLVAFNYAVRNPALEYQLVGEEEIILVAPKGHPLGEKAVQIPGEIYPHIDLRLFAEEEFILQRENQPIGADTRQMLADAGITPKIKLVTQSVIGSVSLVSRGYGCAFCIVYGTNRRPSLLDDVDCYAIGNGGRKVSFVVATRKSNYESEHVQAFIRILKERVGKQTKK